MEQLPLEEEKAEVKPGSSIIHIRAFEKLPVTSEMESIGFFDEIPMNVTYDRDSMIEDLKRAEKYSSAYYV